MDAATAHPPNMGQVLLTRAWLFQAIIAGPTFVLLGIAAIINLYNTYDTIYNFVTHLCTALLAAGIIFIVLVQRQLPGAGRALTLRFEATKSGLATALWLWLMADAIWGPRYHYYYDRRRRIVSSAIAVILLFLFFYPTVYYVLRRKDEEPLAEASRDEEEGAIGERSRLLPGQAGPS